MTLATVALSCAKKLGRVNSAGTSITDLETEIKSEIANVIRFYNRRPWHLTEYRQLQLTTVSGTKWYSTFDMTSGGGDQAGTGRTAVNVNDLMSIDYMRETNTGLNNGMRQVSYREFERNQEGVSGTGTPDAYCLYAGQLGIWPTPASVMTVYFSGHVKPVVPTSDSDTSVWFDEAGEMVEAGTLKRVCLNYLRDRERAKDYAAIEAGEMAEFQSEFVRKVSTGKLKANN